MSYSKTHSLFDGMHKYMFSAENLLRYSADKIENTKQIKSKTTNKPTINTQIFFPQQHDQLFWCLYIIINGVDSYDMIKNNTFKTEKEFKISAVEKLRHIKDLLKINKLKINQVENELVNQSKIGLISLKALCILYELNIIYVNNRFYYKFEYGAKNVKNEIIICDKKGHGIHKNVIEFSKEIESSFLHIENMLKPITSISSYTIKELQIICEKLQITLLDETGKKKSKKGLYESILTKF